MLKMSFYDANTCTDRSLLIDDFSSQSQTDIDQTLHELIDVIQCRVQDAFSS